LVFECETRWGVPQLIKRARKRAGLEHYRPHQVGRHAFATRLLNAGASTSAVKQAGGWKSESRAFDEYYGHLAREVTDRTVAAMKLSPPNSEEAAGVSVTQNLQEAEKSNKSAA
jgi:site-specific recombinase XerD